MGFRFRRSVKVLPGLRLNFSKRGTSWSLGRRGAIVNISKRGVRSTVGIPGTGLSYTEFSRAGQPSTNRAPHANSAEPPPDFDRVLVPSTRVRTRLIATGTILIAIGVIGTVNSDVIASRFQPIAGLATTLGVAALMVGCLKPSRRTLFKRELARRREELSRAYTAIGNDASLAQIDAVLALKERLHLLDTEVDRTELAVLRGFQEALSFQERVSQDGGRFPVVEGHERELGPGETCLYAASASIDGRGVHGPGQLLLTNQRLLFQRPALTTIPWDKLATFELKGMVLRVQRGDRQTPITFTFRSLGEALKADLIGKNLRLPAVGKADA